MRAIRAEIFVFWFVVFLSVISTGCVNSLPSNGEKQKKDFLQYSAVRLHDFLLIAEELPDERGDLILKINDVIYGELVWIDFFKKELIDEEPDNARRWICSSLTRVQGRGVLGNFDEKNFRLASDLVPEFCSD